MGFSKNGKETIIQRVSKGEKHSQCSHIAGYSANISTMRVWTTSSEEDFAWFHQAGVPWIDMDYSPEI